MEENKKQKFLRGDKVKVSEAGAHRLCAGKEAIVIGSYNDQYGCNNIKDYTLMTLDGNSSSWYDESVLTFIEHVGEHEIRRIKDTRAEKEAREGDLDWIIKNWPEIKNKPPGASLQTLANLLNLGSLWGKYGEGIDYKQNSMAVHSIFMEIMDTGDRVKILEFAKQNQGRFKAASSNFNA